MKKHLLLLTCTILSFTLSTFAQTQPFWHWAQGGNQNATSSGIAVDRVGNSYVTGYYVDTVTFGSYQFVCASGVQEPFVVKYDPSGNVLWAKTSVGNAPDWSNDIAVDGNGNCFIGGFFTSTTISFGSFTLTNNGATNNFFLVKYDTDGNEVWAAGAGNTGTSEVRKVAADVSGNAYITGDFTGAVDFGTHQVTTATASPFVAKYDASGNAAWAWAPTGTTAGSLPYGIATDNHGNVYSTGYYTSSLFITGADTLANAATGTADVYIIKLDSMGQAQWARTSSGNNYDAQPRGMAADENGNCFITGQTLANTLIFSNDTMPANPSNYYQVFTVKYDAAGNEIWLRTGTKFTSTNASPYGISTDAIGNCYITGQFYDDITFPGIPAFTNSAGNVGLFVIKYDAAGGIISSGTSAYGNNYAAYGIAIAAYGTNEFYITGYYNATTIPVTFNSTTFSSSYGIFTAKGGGCDAYFTFIQLTAYNLAIVNRANGAYDLSFSWDFGDGSAPDTATYPHHHYDTTGTYTICLSISDTSGCSATYCQTLTVDTNGFLRSTGFDVWVIPPSGVGIEELVSSDKFTVYPNPVRNELLIEINGNRNADNSYNVYSATGVRCLTGKYNGNSKIIDVSMLSSGMYILEIKFANGLRNFAKVIKQ